MRATVVAVIVAAFIASLNVTATAEARGTFVAPAVGVTIVIVGADSSTGAEVTNCDVDTAVRPLPARSAAAVFTRAVYDVDAESGADGASVAVRVPAAYDTVAATAAPPAVGTSVIDDAVIVAGLIASLKVTETDVRTGTSTAPATGENATTLGGVASIGAAVVNDTRYAASSRLAARSRSAVVTSNVYAVLGVSGARGVKVNDVAPATYKTVPGTFAVDPAARSTRLSLLTVAGSSGSLAVTVIGAVMATLVAFAVGTEPAIVGPVRSGSVNVDCADTVDGTDCADPLPIATTVYVYVCSSASPKSVYVGTVTSPTGRPLRRTE